MKSVGNKIFAFLLVFLCARALSQDTNIHMKLVRLTLQLGQEKAQMDRQKASQTARELLSLAEQLSSEDIMREATIIHTHHIIGEALASLGLFEEALENLKKGLDRLQQKKRPSPRLLGDFYHNIAFNLFIMGRHKESLEYCQKALVCYKKLYQSPHADLAECYSLMGQTFLVLGDLPHAKESMQEAWRQRNKLYKTPTVDLVDSYCSMGMLLHEEGDFSKAQEYLEKALHAGEIVAKSEPSLALKAIQFRVYFQMGMTLSSLGRYQEGLEYAQKAFALGKLLYPDFSIMVIPCYQNIGISLYHLGRSAEASEHLQKALSLAEKCYKPPHAVIASIHDNLSEVLMDQKHYSEARMYCSSALHQWTRLYKSPHPRIAITLMREAGLVLRDGKYQEAWKIHNDALDQLLQLYRPPHSLIALCYNNIAYIEYLLEQNSQAWESVTKAFSMKQQLFAQELPMLSNQEKIQRMGHYFDPSHTILLTLCDLQPQENWVSHAFTTTLYCKELVTRVLSQEKEIMRLTQDPTLGQSYERYQTTVKNLNRLAYKPNPTEAEKESLQKLTQQKEEGERQLSRQSSKFQNLLHHPTFSVEDIQKALPEKSALLEFVSYFDMKTRCRRMGVFVVVKGKPVQFISLVSGLKSYVTLILEKLEKDSNEFGRILQKEGKGKAKEFLLREEQNLADITQGLRAFLWTPDLEKAIAGCSMLFLAPDDCLHFLSFGLLAKKKGEDIQYLIEEYDLVYLPCGTSLLREYSKQGKGFYGVGNPNYTLSPQEKHILGEKRGMWKRSLAPSSDESNVRKTRSKSKWASLPGGEKELKYVQKWYGQRHAKEQKILRTNQEAMETLFIVEVPGKRWIHLATHGFFIDTEKSDPSLSLFLGEREVSRDRETVNPLLLSGLVFAGADAPPYDQDDGYLTAADIALLDLQGVQCVVLSCCETGLGKYLSGVGVFSFKWAFEYAGARYLVVSLWKVPDHETLVVMNRFYSSYSGGNAVWKSLLDAQRKYLEHQRKNKTAKSHPYFWAAFICQGNPLPFN